MARLAALGLTQDVLREAVARGVDARRRCTPFHPPSFPGMAQWADTHRALRELLVPVGWQRDDTGGYSTVVDPSGEVAVTVAAGDGRTGRDGLPAPSTKYARGPMTQAAIHGNQLALSLYGEPPADLVDEGEAAKRVTWILLVHTGHHEVRCELSCPRDVDDRGRVVGWSERIMLTSLEVEPTLPILEPADEDEPEIDVPVERL